MTRNRIRLFFGLTLAIFNPLYLSLSPAFSETEQAPTKVTFYCQDIVDSSTGKSLPATFVWIPQRQGNISLIGWKSQFFSNRISPQSRCANVAVKFQSAYDEQRLSYLTTGISSNGYPVVCGVSTVKEKCTDKNILFTLKPNDSPNKVLQQLVDILEGKTSEMLLQSSSDGQSYLPLFDLLKSAPLVTCRSRKVLPPCKLKNAGSPLKP